jgi:hypothetical protein
MKLFFGLIITMSLLTSCGVVEGLDKNCGSDIEEFCNFTFGTRESDQNENLDQLRKELELVKLKLIALELSDEVDQLEMEALTARVIVLETTTPVIAVIDPCPNVTSNSGYKEMLFRLDNGTVIGYFENGNKRFLTEIKHGVSYRTTDDRQCIFTL